MRSWLALALSVMEAGAAAQVDPLAPLSDAPPEVIPAVSQYSPPPLASPTLTGFAGLQVAPCRPGPQRGREGGDDPVGGALPVAQQPRDYA